ncbi:hypothetical protein [Acidisphaera sp. L21]|jgi:hypothetical protein|uniref:hypothetical protein n=1 Tax=Acidisphaera sp. L21 TaxID=1641851 RepID=UPI00131E01AE|nr:hypothetical protein [Acidisphaera sp. L21]
MLSGPVRHDALHVVGLPAMGGSRGAVLASKITAFLAVSDALALSQAEERTLLDLPAADWTALRASPAAAQWLVSPKLERRVDYAITILRRMHAAHQS